MNKIYLHSNDWLWVAKKTTSSYILLSDESIKSHSNCQSWLFHIALLPINKSLQWGNISSRLYIYSEANASELPRNYMHSDIFGRNTHTHTTHTRINIIKTVPFFSGLCWIGWLGGDGYPPFMVGKPVIGGAFGEYHGFGRCQAWPFNSPSLSYITPAEKCCVFCTSVWRLRRTLLIEETWK